MADRKIPRQRSLVIPEVQNPFVHDLKLSTLDKIQIAIMTVTVFPIRLLLVGTCLVLAWMFAAIAIGGKSKDDMKQPIRGWRRFTGPLAVFFSRAVFFVGGFHWVTQYGKQVSSAEAPILATAPHSTFFDALAVVSMGLTSVVAKSEAERVPIFGTLLKFAQPVFVSREDPNSRQNTIKEIRRRANEAGEWQQVVIFPEGTCTNRSCLISFKPGAFIPGAPIQPVCIKYYNKLDTVTWTWEGPGVWKCLWLTLCQFNNQMELQFLPVYTPNEEEKKDAKLFANNVRDVMAKALNTPITDHTFEDCRLMQYAATLNFPAAAGLVEFNKISKKLGLDYNNVKELLANFTKIAQDKKGYLTLDEFASHLNLPVSESLKSMFELYDRNGSGSMDFREYVIGVQLVSRPANTEDTIKLAFQLFDNGAKGYITESELAEILIDAFGMDEVDIKNLFEIVDKDEDGKITYDEFKNYATQQPEYAKLFTTYQELKEANNANQQARVQCSNHAKVKAE